MMASRCLPALIILFILINISFACDDDDDPSTSSGQADDDDNNDDNDASPGDDDDDDDTSPGDDDNDDNTSPVDDDNDTSPGDDDDDTAPGCIWTFEEFAPADKTIWGAAIVMNAADEPVIAYTRSDISGIQLATRDSAGTWAQETVDATGYTDFPAMALGDDGVLHLAYWMAGESLDAAVLRYSHGPSPWTTEEIATTNMGGLDHPSLAVDSQGVAHLGLGYCDLGGVGGYTEVRTNRSGGWSVEWLLASNQMCPGVSVSVATDDVPWIATTLPFTLSRTGILFTAHGDIPFLWPTSIVDANALPSEFSMALSPDNQPVIAFGHSQNKLLVADQRSGDWIVTELPATGRVESARALAMDSDGHLHLVVNKEPTGPLRYGNDVSGAWAFETIDEDVGLFAWASLALDSLGNPHIVYTKEYPYHVRYAGCR